MPPPLRPTLLVRAVPGFTVAYRDEDNNLHVGIFVGLDREGRPVDKPSVVPDTPYYRGQIQDGALVVDEPEVAPAQAPAPAPVGVSAPAPTASAPPAKPRTTRATE